MKPGSGYKPLESTTNMATLAESEALLSNFSNGSNRVSASDRSEYKVYRRRWYILATLCFLNVSNGMAWITFSPIADKTAEFFGVGAMDVNWLSLVFPVATIPLGVVATWLLDTIGLRTGLIMSSWLNTVGSTLRVVSCLPSLPLAMRFPILMAGQTLAACAQPFMLFSPTKVAALWFHESQRTTANMIASMANPLGILLGSLLSPIILTTNSQMLLLMALYSIPGGLATLMATFGVCSSVPPTPPTSSAAEFSEPFKDGLKKIICCKPYWILMVCFGSAIALFTALSTLVEQILCPMGYTDKFAGLCNAMQIGFGLVGAAIVGPIVDKTKKFEEAAKICFSLSSVGTIAFAVMSHYPNQEIVIGISSAVIGFFGFANYAVVLELAVECTYPVAEATSTGFIIISSQIQSIVFILLMQMFAPNFPNDGTLSGTCKSDGGTGIVPQDYTYPTLALAAVGSLASLVMTIFLKSPYKRLRAEQTIAAEKILNYGTTRNGRRPREVNLTDAIFT